VRDIAVDPTGASLISASSDGRILIWEREGMEDLDALLASSCNWLENYLVHNSQADPDIQALCQPPADPNNLETPAAE